MPAVTPFDPLLGHLRASAGHEASQRLDAAHQESERLAREATARFQARRTAELDAVRRRHERERQRKVDEARLATARAILGASERLVNRVMQRARVTARDGQAPTGWLDSTASAAAAYLPDGPVIVRTSSRTAPCVVDGRVIRVVVEDVGPGAIVETEAGDVRVDVTFEQVLRAGRARLAQRIVAHVLEPRP